MKTTWDYTELADSYLKRPDYSELAIDELLRISKVRTGDLVCDIGAGTAHLTKLLAKKNLSVIAIEPNDAMRANGKRVTEHLNNVSWVEGIGEHTGQDNDKFELVTFGSSFNVTERLEALRESNRILKSGGWFACMWNHRDLNDPIQSYIEEIIQSKINSYDYGTRREDQTGVINQSALFNEVVKIESIVYHEQSIEDCLIGWKSHATLHRQAGEKFNDVINEIESYLISLGQSHIKIPYTTRIWTAQVRK